SEVVVSRKLSLVAYVIEDGIVGWQFDYESNPQEIGNYVHNHVLRTSFNGVFGEEVKTDNAQLSAGDVIEKSYSKAVKSDWNIANCKVVAFVYDTDTKEILQAEVVEVAE
ncbi:MAG: Omp28-related outer membrane protein, partial [Bacteroidales bacterium]|nr:Omp28-related outer membrane protein [Bacteroidales bacterium]